METVECDLCGSANSAPYLTSKDYLHGVPGEFTAVRCTECGLIYTSPRPTADEMASYYPDDAAYYVPGDEVRRKRKEYRGLNLTFLKLFKGYFPDEPRSSIKAAALLPLYWLRSHKIVYEGIPDFVPGGRLLEVGCSYGKFLADMRELGWQVDGIETNTGAIEQARTLWGIDVRQGMIDTLGLESGAYDAIVMRMVLEHVHSPKAVLSKLHAALKPGGQLIITVPDIAGVEARAFGRYFYGLQLPTHLYHFTACTLGRMLRESGFEITDVRHNRNDRDYTGSIENKIKEEGRGAITGMMLSKPVRKLFVQFAIKALAAFHMTSRMTVHARRLADG